jgi:hypothetical protein
MAQVISHISCLTFWQLFGFRVFREYAAVEETSGYCDVDKRYSLYMGITRK